MAMLRKIMLVLAIIIAILFAISFALPKEAIVERSVTINTTQEKLFNYLNSMKNFNEWSPWYEMDPKGDYQYFGPDYGVGSKFSWKSDKTGVGSQEIVAANAYSDISLKLEFDGQPPAKVSYFLVAEGDKTKVTWIFKTQLKDPLEKYLGLMMDTFIGPTFDKGLQNLKAKFEN